MFYVWLLSAGEIKLIIVSCDLPNNVLWCSAVYNLVMDYIVVNIRQRIKLQKIIFCLLLYDM